MRCERRSEIYAIGCSHRLPYAFLQIVFVNENIHGDNVAKAEPIRNPYAEFQIQFKIKVIQEGGPWMRRNVRLLKKRVIERARQSKSPQQP